MKKLLAPFLILAAVLTSVKIGFALTAPPTTTPGDKQLIADGDMEAASTGSWSATTATLSKQTTSPHGGQQVLRVAYNSAATGNAAQVVMTVGRTYRVYGWARGDGTSNPCVGDNSCRWSGTSSTSWQRFDVTYTTARTDVRLYGQTLSAGHYVEYDDVFVTEYKGYVKVQDTQIVTDGDMELPNTTYFTAGNNAVLTKSTASHSGKYALRVAYNGTDNPIAIPTAAPQEGKRYHLTGWARGDGSGGIPVVKNGNTTNAWTGTNSNTWQRIDVIYTQGVGNYYYFRMVGSSGYIEFDDMMSTEYKGEADVIDKQLLVDGDMESSGVASWSTAASVLTKETSAPKAGSRNIKITASGAQAYAYAIQNVLTIGKKYHVTGWAKSDGTRLPGVWLGGNTVAWTGSNSTSWQRIDATAIATGNTLFYLGTGSNTGYVEFDDVFVTLAP